MTSCSRRRSTVSTGSPSGRNETRPAWSGFVTTSKRSARSAAARRGDLSDAFEAPLGRGVEGGGEPRQRGHPDPAAVEPLGALTHDVRAVRLMLGLREVARQRDRKRVRLRDDERARDVRAAQPLLARDRVEVERVRLDGDRAGRLGAVDEDGQPGLGLDALGLEGVPAHPRDVRDRDQLRLLGDRLEDPVLRRRHDPGAGCVQRPDQPEVLDVARHDLVVRPEVEPGEDDVAAVGRRSRQRHLRRLHRERRSRAWRARRRAARAPARSTARPRGPARCRRAARRRAPRRLRVRAARSCPR